MPTVMVSPEVLPGIATLVTLLNAFTPFTVLVEFTGITNASVIGLPSMFVPETTTDRGEPVEFAVGETLNARGTSGWVMPDVTVWAVLAPFVAAKTAVVVPAATFFLVSV